MLDFISWLLVFAHLLLGFVGVIFFLSGIDDLFIDLNFVCRTLLRRLFIAPKHKKLTIEDLRAAPEQAVAIMIPAWDESAVIRQMLLNNVPKLEYSNFHVFVGTYPNDAATGREVDAVCAQYPNVHRTLCPKDGPTNKADCLNWIYQGILAFEEENDIRFEIFLMEDSEDILHPLCLKLFNRLIPRKDMVQLPVLPLETKWYDFVSGHYIDEFTEHHTKDVWVRERLAKGIPAAGVGAAFSRRALEYMASRHRNQVFSIDSLTEDYEFGMRLRSHGFEGVFVRQRLPMPDRRRKRGLTSLGNCADEYVAVRAYFPATFKTAVRQKSRWVLGITLQGWANLGWRGDLRSRYMFLRDRKALLTSQVGVLGYLIVVIQCWIWASQWLIPDAYRFPPVIERGSLLWNLILVDFALAANRLAWRVASTYRVYGWFQALLSAPRQVCANFINSAAVLRAVRQHIGYLRTGVLVKWDKTAHVFPSQGQATQFHKKLGDLLLERELICSDDLESALAWQDKVKRPLGSLLLRMGSIDEKELTEVLSEQLNLPIERLDAHDTSGEALGALPPEMGIRHSVFPVRILENGRLLVAVAHRLKPQHVIELETASDRKISLCLTKPSELALALRFAYGTLGESVAEHQSIPPGVPEFAVGAQKPQGSRDGRKPEVEEAA